MNSSFQWLLYFKSVKMYSQDEHVLMKMMFMQNYLWNTNNLVGEMVKNYKNSWKCYLYLKCVLDKK